MAGSALTTAGTAWANPLLAGAGVGAIYGLGTQAGQRALAGQLPWQRTIRGITSKKGALDKNTRSAISDALRRGAVMPRFDEEEEN